MGRHVQRTQRDRVATRKSLGLVTGRPQLGMERLRRRELQGRDQVPEQFVELPHDRECGEHPRCDVGFGPPVGPGERLAGDPLTRAEAVVGDASSEPQVQQARVDLALEVGLQVRACLPGGLVDREVR